MTVNNINHVNCGAPIHEDDGCVGRTWGGKSNSHGKSDVQGQSTVHSLGLAESYSAVG